MAQMQKKTTRPTMKRKKPTKNNNTILFASGLGGVVFLGIVYLLFVREGNPPVGSLGLIPLNERKYGQTALRKHPGVKIIELAREVKKAGEPPELVQLYKNQMHLLNKMEDIRWLIPWESSYFQIKEQEIKSNAALAAFRLELMELFESMLGKLQDAIEDPTEGSLAEMRNYIRSSETLIRDAIRETKSKANELGPANAEIITKALTGLLDKGNE